MRHVFDRCFDSRGERQWVLSLFVATGLHGAVLVALFLLALPAAPAESAADLGSRWSIVDAPAEEAFEPLAPVEVTAENRTRELGGSRRRASVSEAIDEASPSAAAEVRLSRHSRLPVPTPGGGEFVAVLPGLGEVATRGEGAGEGDGSGDGAGGRFFGLGTRGRSFVFVVDCSQSMSAPHDSEAKTRLGRVKLEMIESIAAMTPDQRFFVIYFNARPLPMPARRLQSADERSKAFYLDWIARMKPQGDTNPEDALLLAVSLQPEVVYFLTDGIIPRGNKVIRTVTGFNQGRVPIHTFCFAEKSGEKMLKVLAERNGGEYHFVP